MALSIWVPVAYIGALVVSLSLFSSVYRKRSAKNLAKGSSEPWHPDGHPERDVYQTLVAAAASGQTIPDHLLKAALVARAMTDVNRINSLRESKQALTILIQKGSIGDETVARFALAEKEMEAEILDVISEANTFKQGWGQTIFPTAAEMVQHMKIKEAYQAIPEERKKRTEALKSQGVSIPQPTVTLPPLFTPPGTQIQVQAPQGPTPQQLANMPPQLRQQILQMQAAQAQAQSQAQARAQSQAQGQGKQVASISPVTSNGTSPSASTATNSASTPSPGKAAPVTSSSKGGQSTTSPSMPLTPSSKGNTSTASSSLPSTPASQTTPEVEDGVAGGVDDEDDEEEDGDGEEGDESIGGVGGPSIVGSDGVTAPVASVGATGSSGTGSELNRAQRRAQNKKKKKGSKK